MKSSVAHRVSASAAPRHQVAHLLQTLSARITALGKKAEMLRARIAGDSPSYAGLRTCVETLLHELCAAARALAARASALGRRVAARRMRALRFSRGPQKIDELIQVPAQLAGALLAECQACGARLCALIEAARRERDDASERAAYALMRVLEKQLWLLRPHATETAQPFSTLRLA